MCRSSHFNFQAFPPDFFPPLFPALFPEFFPPLFPELFPDLPFGGLNPFPALLPAPPR
jgi:hypothetical protein